MLGLARSSWAALASAVCLLLGAQQAAAIIYNPSFEPPQDTSQWQTVGDVSVVDDSFGIDPPYGDQQILLTTDSDNGAVDDDVMETVMGMEAGTIQAIFEQDILIPGESTGAGPAEGSAFQQTFDSSEPGDTVTFSYKLLTNEAVYQSVSTDFIWWELDRPMGTTLSGAIAHVNEPGFSPSGTSYDFETDYQTFTVQLNQPGTYKITIGLNNVQNDLGETFANTAAVFDGFFLSKAPEPNTFLLFAAGLLGLAFHARWVKGSRGRK